MEKMPNISALCSYLDQNGWQITGFFFDYNGRKCITLFESIRRLENPQINAAKRNGMISRLTFIKRSPHTDSMQELKVFANAYRFEVSPTELRNFFGIRFAENLSDFFANFYSYFNKFVPEIPKFDSDEQIRHEMIQTLDINDGNDPSKLCCFKAMRNGIYNGKQKTRTIFNSEKTRLLRPTLFKKFENDISVSFCYRDTCPLSDDEIYNQFVISYGLPHA